MGADTKSSKWRTVAAMVITQAMLLLALVVCLRAGAMGKEMLPTICWSMVLCFTAVATHNGIQHLAAVGGGGVSGVASAFMGQKPAPAPVPAPTKPEEPLKGD